MTCPTRVPRGPRTTQAVCEVRLLWFGDHSYLNGGPVSRPKPGAEREAVKDALAAGAAGPLPTCAL